MVAATKNHDSAVVSDTSSNVPTVLTKLEKWGEYESCSLGAVSPTHFIPMKTPLSEALLRGWQQEKPPEHPWTVRSLLETQKAAGRSVGLIIDLSNHETLYADDIPAGLAYQHVQLVAKMLPSQETVQEVIRVAQQYWKQHPMQHIAIHCAYGFNRTGFIVCSYLVEQLGMTVDEALDSFAAVRPPGVKHKDFIEELYLRYHTEGPEFAAAAAAARAVASSSKDPAEPCMPLNQNTAAQPATAVQLPPSAASASAQHDSADAQSVILPVDSGSDCSQEPAAANHSSAAAQKTREWLLGGRGFVQQSATVIEMDGQQSCTQAAPSGERAAPWAARLEAAAEGQQDEDNDSLQTDSGQLRGSMSGLVWSTSPRPSIRSPSHRLSRVCSTIENSSSVPPHAEGNACCGNGELSSPDSVPCEVVVVDAASSRHAEEGLVNAVLADAGEDPIVHSRHPPGSHPAASAVVTSPFAAVVQRQQEQQHLSSTPPALQPQSSDAGADDPRQQLRRRRKPCCIM